jgi:hypothetical protein
MKKKLSKAYWIPDMDTFNQLQKLKKFVDFVAGLAYSTAEQKNKAEEIKLLIENIDKPETFLKEWCVCFEIFDFEVQAGNGTGIYWRGWRVYLELGRFEIIANYYILDDDRWTDDYPTFYGIFNFEKETTYERIWGDTNLDEFIADAMNYKSYITESLNEIEVEIDVWNRDRKQSELKSKTPKPYKVNINLDIDKIVGKYLK